MSYCQQCKNEAKELAQFNGRFVCKECHPELFRSRGVEVSANKKSNFRGIKR